MVTTDAIRRIVREVTDPELPMLTIEDLGILRAVTVDGNHAVVTITPTFSGCPAIPVIRRALRSRLDAAGCHDVTVRTSFAPAWTSQWITADGRRKLAEAGIAPPSGGARVDAPVFLGRPEPVVPCPRCGSAHTHVTADFGATACKSLHRCDDCDEPFEHIKDG